MFRNSDRKSRTSSAIRPRTPSPEEGQSSLAWPIQGSERCCPQVVGIRKGTGTRAHWSTRTAIEQGLKASVWVYICREPNRDVTRPTGPVIVAGTIYMWAAPASTPTF